MQNSTEQNENLKLAFTLIDKYWEKTDDEININIENVKHIIILKEAELENQL